MREERDERDMREERYERGEIREKREMREEWRGEMRKFVEQCTTSVPLMLQIRQRTAAVSAKL